MPTYTVTDPQTGRSLRLTGDSPPSESELEDIFKSQAPAPEPTRGGLSHPLTSVFTKPEQASVVGKILGHEVPAAPEDTTTLSDVVTAAKAHPIRTAGETVLGLTGLPSIYEFLKTAKETGSDIASGLVHHPIETLRGGVAGTVEGLMEQATPANLALLALGRYKAMRGGAAAAPEVVTDRLAPRVAGKAPKLEDTLREMLEEIRAKKAEPQTVSARPEPNITGAGKEGAFASSGRPAVTAGRYREITTPRETPPPPAHVLEQPVTGGHHVFDAVNEALGQEPLPTGGNGNAASAAANAEAIPRKSFGTKQAKIADTDQGARELESLLSDIHGEFPIKGNGTYTDGVLDKFHEMMGRKGATIDGAVDTALKSGNVDAAAKTIEGKVKLTVNEVAEAMRRQYGSRRAGDMLYGYSREKAAGDAMKRGAERQAAIRRLAPGPSRRPVVAEIADENQRLQYLLDSEKGGINPKIALAAGGGAVGAAAGGTQGDTSEERIQNAILGGVTGAVALPLIGHVLASTGPKKMQSLLYTSILSSPQSIVKAYLGGAGGAIAAATEKIVAGEGAAGARIIRRLFSPQHVSDIRTAFRSGGAMTNRAEGAPSLINRAFDAVNEPAIRAMEAGGVSRDDAIRYTLSGVPTSPLGRDILGLWSRWFPLRLATTLFPRVGIQILERGLERSPAGLVKQFSLSTAGSAKVRAARAVMGPAAGAAAYALNDQTPDWAKPYLTALSGVYGLPVGLGFAVGEARQRGKTPKQQLAAATDEFAKNLPFPQYGPAEVLNPESIAAMAVPNLARDVARARDPYERDTRGQMFGRAKAKIPGLRETLPVKGRNVNLAGQPTEDRTSAVERFFTPSAKEPSPEKGIPDRVASEIRRLEVKVNIPSFERTIEVGKRKVAVPTDAAERARAERRQYFVPQIERLLNTPAYQRADDTKKKRMLEGVISRAEAAGSQRARANVLRLLRDTGALR